MKTFPMFLTMTDRSVVIAGGGEQAAQKCRLILKTDARITVLAPALDPELADLHAAGKIIWDNTAITPAHFAGTALVFIATGCPGVDCALHALAKQAGATVNVVDRPDLCDAITPSIVDRSPVVVAIGTEGTAPVLARQIKTRMEEILEPRLGDLAAIVGRLRDSAAQRLQPRQRRDLWRWVFNGPARDAHKRGAEREAAQLIKDAIATGDFGGGETCAIAFVGAGPGAKDLMTLRGVQRLQEADVIFYDATVDPQMLELARRDAARVNIDQATLGAPAHPLGLLIAAAKQGNRVVRLCGGTAHISQGDAGALHAADIAFEAVPGVAGAPITLSQAI
ncbi:uroporphyrin-III C-methyltransferase / precorrin-2 dehydrogenase / sirohydrochlorin ferrochelatase [Yoonia tamlensis]|uniref:precorrin-2 dehydrogenase n=1 Tax=Yoonia tamlensis TaxID=390270 RepID=A0A1I6FVP0_9RHOB|nr:siroheme synthase [Yoonia tamlensis]SFR33968.1 uroporphyrin-III C-methyltransferase / precorrin-2 dehydrogenase / sirohydrochlorin ferrochelatase [Yoonia tamlensis]